MHAERGASLGRSLRSLHRTMAVSNAWLSRRICERRGDGGVLTAPQLLDIYVFAKFNSHTQRLAFLF